jgi:hypothetical protein
MNLSARLIPGDSGGVAKVAELHQKWARATPEGAMCSQCMELNALHSQSVDGASINIPERLRNPPKSEEPYVIDVLVRDAENFASSFGRENATASAISPASTQDAETMITELMKSQPGALSEYELFNMANALARKHHISMRRYLPYIDFGALSTQEKYAISTAIDLPPEEEPYVWNSLLRSDILAPQDLEQRQLDGRLRLQRLYSSRIQGRAAFFEYLRIAMQDFTRKLMILKVCIIQTRLSQMQVLTRRRWTIGSRSASSSTERLLGMKNLKLTIMSWSVRSCHGLGK